MIYLYLTLVIGLSIFDIWNFKKQGLSKDIYIYIGCMIFVTIFGVVYLTDSFRPSISSYVLKFFSV